MNGSPSGAFSPRTRAGEPKAHLPAEHVVVRSTAADIAVAIDALLENVFAHTAEGAGFDVYVEPRHRRGRRSDRDRRRARAQRWQDSVREGAAREGRPGLGLDIVRRTAEAAGGRLWLANLAGGGAVITAELGADQFFATD